MILLGGLLIGLAAGLTLAVVWPYPPLPESTICVYHGRQIHLGNMMFPERCLPTFMFFQPLVWGSFLTAGALFGLLAHKLTGRGSRIPVVAVGGFSFLLASFVGGEVVATIPTPELPIFFSGSTADPFAIMVFGLSLTFALAIALALRTRGLLWRALAAAAVTAICYWLVAWLLFGHGNMLWNPDPTITPLINSLSELGRPMGPMMKTTFISNFIAGTIGGWATLVLLTTRS
jgi:hypothetical protein